jgi:rod shape-determining protein MreC
VYQRRRARILLALLVLTSLVLITISFREDDDGALGGLRGVLTTVFQPVQDGLATVLRPIGDATSGIGEVFRTRSENQRLRRELEVVSERHRSLTDVERENAELRELIGLRDRADLDTIAARTVALAPSNFEWTITIDAGSEDGVERGMPVINGRGLVGRVIQVTPNASRVLLAIDLEFGAAARVAVNGETGTISGRGGDPMLFQPLDPEAPIEVGDEIVTAPYRGGVFPGGIPIGTVAEVSDPTTRLTREVEVSPFVDFTRLHHVLVVVDAPIGEIPPMEGSPDIDFTPPDVAPMLDPDALEDEDDEDDEDEDEDDEDDG